MHLFCKHSVFLAVFRKIKILLIKLSRNLIICTVLGRLNFGNTV